jgi:DNA-binding NtrC family response regulator
LFFDVAVLFKEGDVLEPQDFELDAGDGLSATTTLDLSLEDLEARHVRRILEHEKGSVTKAAQRLGIQRNTLYSKIKKYGLEQPDV